MFLKITILVIEKSRTGVKMIFSYEVNYLYSMEPTLIPIGIVRSPLKELKDCPLQENEKAPEALIEINVEFIQALKDIQPGDRLIILSWLHQSDRTVLITKPRNDPNAALTGIFSTRSPDRPNPIGIHFVRAVAIDHNTLRVSGLELLDQTPIIDIKPDLS